MHLQYLFADDSMTKTRIGFFRCASTILFLLLFIATGCSQEITVVVRVFPPSDTPAGSRIYIAGNTSALGDWNPAKVELTKDDSGWIHLFKVSNGQAVEFKITRGSWNNQAIYNQDEIPGNFRFMPVRDTLIQIMPFSWQDVRKGEGGGITGTVHYHRGLQGAGLNHARDVIVWLPPGYEKEKRKRFPVLYMHDGQNIIDPSTSFIGYDWHVDEVADSLIKAGAIEEIIIVGISNSADRGPEYSDTELGRSYASFVVHTLKPLIDSTYRTMPDAANTAVMGSSMGGLISFLFVWWHPDVFSKAGCLSSAFLYHEDKNLKEVRSFEGPLKNIRVYMDCGTVDLEARLKPGSEDMAHILQEQGYRKGLDFEYFLDQGALHDERAWARRVWRPLRFLFGKK